MKRIQNSGAILILGLAWLLCISCATNRPPAHLDISPEFSGHLLNRGGLAVLPVLSAPHVQSISNIESYTEEAGLTIVNNLNDAHPSLKVLGPAEVMEKLRTLDDDGFEKFKTHLHQDGIVDFSAAPQWRQILQTQYLLCTSIDSLDGTENVSYKPQADATVNARIIDLNSSKVVLETTIKEEEVSIQGSYPFDRAIQTAVRKLGRVLTDLYTDI